MPLSPEILELLCCAKENKNESLSIPQIAMDAADLIELTQHLQGTEVHTLHLSYNKIGNDGASMLVRHLQGIEVYTLSLVGNYIDAAGANALAQHLKDTKVRILDLSCNELSDGGVIALAQHLKDTEVHTLNLSSNNIGAIGITALAQHLKDTKVRILDLSCNELSDGGVIALAQHLKDTEVHTLNLSLNHIGVIGADALAQYLKNTKVQVLSLCSNIIGDAGANALAQHLKDTNVQFLTLDSLAIEPSIIKKLELILQANRQKPIIALADAAAKSSTLSQLPLELLTEIVSYTEQSKHSGSSTRKNRTAKETNMMVLAESAFHAAGEKVLAQAMPILDEYATSTTPKDTFFPESREYSAEVKEIVEQIKDGSLNNKKHLLEELNQIKTKPRYKEERALTMLIESIEGLGVRVSHQC